MASSSTSQTQTNFGSSTELFNANCSARVVLLDYDDNREVKLLRYGGFIVNVIMQLASPLLMVTCTVDGLQWPISKDAPIIRVGKRCFAFGMPGLLYGLQFLDFCEDEKMDTLERVFKKYGHYHELDTSKLTGDVISDSDDPKFWKNLLPSIEAIVHNKLSQFGHHPGKSPSAVGNQYSGLVRVLRTSSSTKMVGVAILSGSLKSNHIEIQDMRSKQKCGDDSGNSDDIMSKQMFASISVFTNLVEAVEVFWVIASGKSDLLNKKITSLQELVGFKMWRLNQLGIAAFMEKLAVEE
ncbi:hypothetical protein ACOSQ4_022128 [Xanthoceras sorbifolium]